MEHITSFHMLGGPLIETALTVGSLLVAATLILIVRPKQVTRDAQHRREAGEQPRDDA